MSKTKMTQEEAMQQAKSILNLLKNQDKWNEKLEDKINKMVDITSQMIDQMNRQNDSLHTALLKMNEAIETLNKLTDAVNAHNKILRILTADDTEEGDKK